MRRRMFPNLTQRQNAANDSLLKPRIDSILGKVPSRYHDVIPAKSDVFLARVGDRASRSTGLFEECVGGEEGQIAKELLNCRFLIGFG